MTVLDKDKLIIHYAIKGLTQEIQELDRDVRTGCKYIENRVKGEKKDKSPLSDYELNVKVDELLVKIEELEELKNELKWMYI